MAKSVFDFRGKTSITKELIHMIKDWVGCDYPSGHMLPNLLMFKCSKCKRTLKLSEIEQISHNLIGVAVVTSSSPICVEDIEVLCSECLSNNLLTTNSEEK